MSGYADLHEEALAAYQEREYKRRRVLSIIRGGLRKHASPRWLTAGCFALSLLPGLFLAASLHSFIHFSWAGSGFLGVLLAWPLFIGVLWQVSRSLAAKAPLLRDFADHKALDDERTAEENQKEYGQGVSAGLRSGMQQGGGMAFPVLIVVALVTCGTYLAWSLIRYGPTLLAETVLDAHFAKIHPQWSDQIVFEDWAKNLFLRTAVHFVGLAIVILLLAAIISISAFSSSRPFSL